jgi:hypothetical protein
MLTVNPTEFVCQFRDELIRDLDLNESILCPKCCITYVGEYDGCCRYERASDSDYDSDDPITAEVLATKYELVCIFDYEDTPMSVVLNAWTEQLLKDCYAVGGDPLRQKWAKKIAEARLEILKHPDLKVLIQ